MGMGERRERIRRMVRLNRVVEGRWREGLVEREFARWYSENSNCERNHAKCQ